MVCLLAMQRSSPLLRRRLPITRPGVTHKFDIAGHEGYIRTGEYEDGSLGEIFVNLGKVGSTIDGVVDAVAIITSIALQWGTPLYDLVSKFSYVRYEPMGITPNPQIRFAYSITDYIFRWLGLRYLTPEQQQELHLLEHDLPADHH